jgi:hypothetical protein
MCPNWQTTSTRTTSAIDTRPKWTFVDPTPTTTEYPPASCSCEIPIQADIGLCSTKFVAEGGPRINKINSWCACESEERVDFSTVCGQLVCPNLRKTTEFVRPTPCPASACNWPTNTELGRCASVTVEPMPGAFQHYSLTEYCVCAGETTATIDLVTGFDGSRVCPNQRELVTNTWAAATQRWCPTELPHLPFFESCGIYTWSTVIDTLPGLEPKHTSYSTMCTCNDVSDNVSIWQIPTVRGVSSCGEYLCHNSASLIPDTLEPSKSLRISIRDLQRTTSATAFMPLLAVTTDATPGSMPTAAEPTSSSGG